MAFEDVFVTNSYCDNSSVVACYGVACLISQNKPHEKHWTHTGNNYDEWPNSHKGYNGRGCLTEDLNSVRVDKNGQIHVYEWSETDGSATGGKGWMAGDYDWSPSNKLQDGMIIYWHTSRNNGTKNWNHYGRLHKKSGNFS